jgi:small-conductance mechanosensitive channel
MSTASESTANTQMQDRLLTIYLKEYDKLKTEQTQRIGFRDNLLYVTLGVFGAVFSYAIGDSKNYEALLVLPWVGFVLGWTYLINDEKISAIGQYLREVLDLNIKSLTETTNDSLLSWEHNHITSKKRQARKLFQLFVNIITFCLSGLGALAVFWVKVSTVTQLMQGLIGIGVILLITLGGWFVIYAGLKD